MDRPVERLFISDLHLDADEPQGIERFEAFCAGPARLATALFILGDLFEAWVGDDDDAALAASVRATLRTLHEGGTEVAVMRGNRDFLLDQNFARDTGARLLADPHLLQLGHRSILLSHGDALCTDDHAYMQLRQRLQDPGVRQALLDEPLPARRALARSARDASRARNAQAAEAIMDVNPAAVASLLARHEVDLLIHGHTHRPADHHWQTSAGRAQRRIVLGSWADTPVRYARALDDAVELLAFDA